RIENAGCGRAGSRRGGSRLLDARIEIQASRCSPAGGMAYGRGRRHDGPAWTDLARAACHPVAPAVLGAVEDVEIDLSLDAMRQAGAGILPEQPLAARIDLRRVLCDRTQPEG